MPDTVTPNYDMVKPEDGGSNSTWGAKTNGNWDIVDNIVKTAEDAAALNATNIPLRARWMGKWAAGTYYANDMVTDGLWTMIANKQTTDRAAPVPAGSPDYVYLGASPTVATIAGSILFGQKYVLPADKAAAIRGYRFYTVEGNFYSVYVKITTPEGDVSTRQLINMEATSTGWTDVDVGNGIWLPGTILELIVSARAPDPSPTETVFNYDYQAPNQVANPSAGEIQHARFDSDTMLINYVDSDTNDNTAYLQGLSAGDTITIAGIVYVIQAVAAQGSWLEVNVSPTSQQSEGVQEVTFAATSAQSITNVQDPTYWAANPNVTGLFVADGGYDDLVENDTAYGSDLLVDELTISDDWDVMAISGTGIAGNVPNDPAPPALKNEEVHQQNNNNVSVSYRIVGTTLECWGRNTSSNGNKNITFPKSFKYDPSVQVVVEYTSGRTPIAAVNSRSETNFGFFVVNPENDGYSNNERVHWYAIGEWDGV